MSKKSTRYHAIAVFLVGLGLSSMGITAVHGQPAVQQPRESGPTHLSEITINGREYNLVRFHNPNAGVDWFEAGAREQHLRGHIVSCTALIDLPVGVADGNHSYGGVCLLRESGEDVPIMVCHDVMLGRFKTKPIDGTKPNTAALAKFVADNCYGG